MAFRAEGFIKLMKDVTGVTLRELTMPQMAEINRLLDTSFKPVQNHPEQRQAEFLRLRYGLENAPLSTDDLAREFKISPTSAKAKVERCLALLQTSFMKEFVEIIKPHLGEKSDNLPECQKRIAELEQEVRELRGRLASIAGLAALTPDGETKLSKLELSKRIRNAFKWEKIDTVEQLMRYSAHDLIRLQNFGRKCLIELNQQLCLHGFDPIK